MNVVLEYAYAHSQIIAIVIIFALYVYGLFRVIKSTRENLAKNKGAIVNGFTLATLFLIYLVFNVYSIEPKDWAQIWLMFGLVLVTTMYAISTAKQAEASVKMAEEMREQRYDAVRPIIDIELKEKEPTMNLTQEGAGTKETPYFDFLNCVLRNIGVGPATDVYSFTPSISGERRQLHFAGSLKIGGETPEMPLYLEQRESRWCLVAYYKDVYDRYFKSSREVSVDMKKNTFIIGHLEIHPSNKEELP